MLAETMLFGVTNGQKTVFSLLNENKTFLYSYFHGGIFFMKQIGIKVEIDPSLEESIVIIRTNQRTERINQIIEAIERCDRKEHPQITAYSGERTVLINRQEIVRVYTENRRVVISTDTGDYDPRLSLKKLEEMLDPATFVRISRFEIINLSRVSGFDFSMEGTVQVHFDNGSFTWVSRRYVHIIQQTLGRLTKQGEG